MKYQVRNIIHVIQVGQVTALEVCKCKKLWQHENSSRNTTKALQLELTAAPHKNMYTKHSKAEFERNTKKIAEGASARRNSYTQMHQKNP